MRTDRVLAPTGGRRPFLLAGYLALLVLLAACVSCGDKSVAPIGAVSPDTLNFGNVPLGETADRAFVLTNLGADSLLGRLSVPCSGYSVLGGGSFSLGPGQATTLTVRFTPTTPGVQDCELSTGVKGCPLIRAYASSDTGNTCGVSAAFLDFGSVPVGQTLDRTVTFFNAGTGILTARLASSCGDFRNLGSTGGPLLPGDSIVLAIRFQPSIAGLQECEFTTGLPCRPIRVRGVGLLCPVTLETSQNLDFGDVRIGDYADRPISLTNRGPATVSGTLGPLCPGLTLLGFEGLPDSTYDLPPLQSKAFTLRWSPQATGYFSCSVSLGNSNCSEVAVQGHAVPGEPPGTCSVVPDSLDFGTVPVGQSAQRSFTITNSSGTGNTDVLSGTVRVDCGNYQVVGGTPYTLSAGQSAVITIQFTPTAAGREDCTLTTGLVLCGSLRATGVGQ